MGASTIVLQHLKDGRGRWNMYRPALCAAAVSLAAAAAAFAAACCCWLLAAAAAGCSGLEAQAFPHSASVALNQSHVACSSLPLLPLLLLLLLLLLVLPLNSLFQLAQRGE